MSFCAATEYYVTTQSSSCPDDHCYTLNELAIKYDYARVNNIVLTNTTVYFLNGTHELKRSIIVKEAHNLTWVGARTAASGIRDVTINCTGMYGVVMFQNIVNLNVAGITFTHCGKVPSTKGLPIGALIFSDVFNLQLAWVTVQSSTYGGIYGLNIMGNSSIEHSVFQSNGVKFYSDSDPHVHIRYTNCMQLHYSTLYSHKCSANFLSMLLAENSHQLVIHDCVLKGGTSGSMRIGLYHNNFAISLLVANTTLLYGHTPDMWSSDVSLDIKAEANCLVTFSNVSLSMGYGEGYAFTSKIAPQVSENYLRKIHITNCTIDKYSRGILFDSDRSQEDYGRAKSITTQILLEHCNITRMANQSIGIGMTITLQANTNSQYFWVLKNVCFKDNKSSTKLTTIVNSEQPLPSIIFLEYADNIHLSDCRFIGNKGTPIAVYDSNVTVFDTLIFANNTGYQGGAIEFYRESHMIVSHRRNTELLFINNHAEHFGGAIFVQDSKDNNYRRDKSCFLQLEDSFVCPTLKSNRLHFTFKNNTARDGGDAIYGGSMHYCIACVCNYRTYIRASDIFIFNYWNMVHYEVPSGSSNLSLISSKPTRMCLCEDEEPDCLNVLTNDTRYPGETFTISAVVVGQGFGTADGSVYAQFLPLNEDLPPSFNELQQSQKVNHKSCRKLKYTVLSSNPEEVIVLTANSIVVSEYLPPLYVEESVQLYKHLQIKQYETGLSYLAVYQIQDLLSFPVYINVTLLPCPSGFMLSNKSAKCICHTTLQNHNISCNIDDQTVHREGTMWINTSFAGNKSNGVVVHQHCPYGYCSREELDINLDFPDTQCNLNHSGVLCGGCRPGLSLALGSSRCLKCSNKYIALLIPFALAGVVLVVFMKLLNLTVSEGTLNGLIFYANIVGANQATFFPPGNTQCPLLTVFIIWLNLDLGIETCFVDGLNGYWKTWLQFVFPAYIWIITAVIIVVSHYSSTGAKIFGSNSVKVLATLFLLSYTKLLRTIITASAFTLLEYPDQLTSTVWLYDGNTPYLSTAHIPLFLVALTTFLFLWLPFTLILLFMQCIRKKTQYRALHCFVRLKPLFDAYFGPFKDKHCYWVGVMLLMRTLLLVIYAINPSNTPRLNLFAIAITTFALVTYTATVGKVYKKWYLTLLENSFLFNLGVLALGTLYTRGQGSSHSAVVHTLVGITFLTFVGIVIFHGYTCIRGARIWRDCWQKLSKQREQNQPENIPFHYVPLEGSQAEPFRENRNQGKQQVMTFNELREPVLDYITAL